MPTSEVAELYRLAEAAGGTVSFVSPSWEGGPHRVHFWNEDTGELREVEGDTFEHAVAAMTEELA